MITNQKYFLRKSTELVEYYCDKCYVVYLKKSITIRDNNKKLIKLTLWDL